MKNISWNAVWKYWLPLACGLTIACGLVYVAVQQDMRQSANDPQIQMAEDAAAALAAGGAPQSVVPTNTIDIAQSLAPWIAVYDANGNPVASDGSFNNAMPVPPGGVFTYTKANGEDRVTWQVQQAESSSSPGPGELPTAPLPAVRSAIVVVNYHGVMNSGFVVSGRSLREVENREGKLSDEIYLALAAALLVTFVLTVFFQLMFAA